MGPLINCFLLLLKRNSTLNSQSHPHLGGDEGPAEAWVERSVLLPDRECGLVLHGSLQRARRLAGCGPGSCPGRCRPAHLQPHPAAQEEDRTEDTSGRRLCGLPLGHQGGKGGHVSRFIVHLLMYFTFLSCTWADRQEKITLHPQVLNVSFYTVWSWGCLPIKMPVVDWVFVHDDYALVEHIWNPRAWQFLTFLTH